ncbi:MAG: SAM-dependent methyltransferase, partial [Calditrichaeota bacterium]|nr:SAM-dependent methyltransferase [Calditrichota bacterium]
MAQVFSKTARYYDTLYAHKDHAGEARGLLSLLGGQPAGTQRTLLDVACGTGRHLMHLQAHFR